MQDNFNPIPVTNQNDAQKDPSFSLSSNNAQPSFEEIENYKAFRKALIRLQNGSKE